MPVAALNREAYSGLLQDLLELLGDDNAIGGKDYIVTGAGRTVSHVSRRRINSLMHTDYRRARRWWPEIVRALF